MQQSSVNSKFTFLADEYEAAKLGWAGGAERPNWRGNEPKKTGARSARARTRGQNPLVLHICGKSRVISASPSACFFSHFTDKQERPRHTELSVL